MSKIGFVFVVVGVVVGFGVIWKFLYVVGNGGGGVFFFVFLLLILFIGMFFLIVEFVIGCSM